MICNHVVRIMLKRGAWLAQSIEHVTLDLGVVNLSPTLGLELTFFFFQLAIIAPRINLIGYDTATAQSSFPIWIYALTIHTSVWMMRISKVR